MRFIPLAAVAAVFLMAVDAGARDLRCETGASVISRPADCTPNPGATTPAQVSVGIESFHSLPDRVDAVIAQVGRAPLSFTYRRTEYWLYANAVGDDGTGRLVSPELLVRDGYVLQVNWLPVQMMAKSVAAVKGLEGWKPSGDAKVKHLYSADGDIEGKSRHTVFGRFGPPDAKKVSNGLEIWEYEKVRHSPSDPQELTLFIEFDGDRALRMAGY